MQERSGTQQCDRENDLITFLYGECSETEARKFEEHLGTCAVCESDLAGFRQIRESMTSWRQEVLGASEAAPSGAVAVSNSRSAETRHRSAMAAFREFFNLSPLWLKGAVAFASILFGLFAILTLINLRDQSKPSLTSTDKLYTQEELNRKIDEAVTASRQQFAADKERMAQVEKESQSDLTTDAGRHSVATHGRKVQRRPLSKSEREQLATDLRLISSSEELSLDLLGDRINDE